MKIYCMMMDAEQRTMILYDAKRYDAKRLCLGQHLGGFAIVGLHLPWNIEKIQ